MSNWKGINLDPWARLRKHTSARIALGRAGGSLPTSALLDFSLAHAAARDAVRSDLDFDRLEQDLAGTNLPVLRLQTAVEDRATFLMRPDLGRRLSAASRTLLESPTPRTVAQDVAIIVADGLSAIAAQIQAAPTLNALVPLLLDASLKIAPLSLVRFGRVGVQDEIGSILRARIAVILLGERPGLGSPDSLGAYLVWGPRPGRTDAERNCVSNIRPAGLAPDAAAQTLNYLIVESLRRRLSGTALKDERTPVPSAPTDRSNNLLR